MGVYCYNHTLITPPKADGLSRGEYDTGADESVIIEESKKQTEGLKMDRTELRKKAEKFIKDYTAKSGITMPVCNIEGLTAQLVEFYEPSEESLHREAEKMVGMKLPKNHPQFSRLVEELIAFWKEQPADEPVLSFYSDERDEIRGSVANGYNLYLKKPDDWRIRVEAAKRAK